MGTANGLAQWQGGHLTVHAKVGRFGALLEDRAGTVWAGHTRAQAELPPLCRLSNGELHCVGPADGLPLRFVGALSEDREGDLWVGGDGGVCRWRSSVASCHPLPGLAGLADKAGVFAIASDAGGNLWASAGPSGVWRMERGEWRHDGELPGLEFDSQAMLADRRGSLWLGLRTSGLRRITARETEPFTQAQGLTGDIINDLFEDREGNLWVATSGGLDRFRDVRVATLTAREGLPGGSVAAVAAARGGGVWVADRGALVRLNAGELTLYGPTQGLPGGTPTSLLEDSRGRLWVGVDAGLAWRERARFRLLASPDGGDIGVVRSIVEDSDGDIWAITTDPSRALLRIRGDRIVEMLPRDRFRGQQVLALAANPGGGVWVALANLGLELYRDGSFESHSFAGDEGGTRTRGLFADSRGVWMVTNRGLVRVAGGRRDRLDSVNGLPCDDIEAAVEGDDGSLWVKSACGLVRIPPSELDAWSAEPSRTVAVQVLDAFDGALAGLPPFTPVATRSVDGHLWFASEDAGLQTVDPSRLEGNVVAPLVQILRILADRKPYPSSARLTLPPLVRDLEIDYTALSFSVPEKVRFRYRLEGADPEWKEVGSRREAFFNNLAPGDYRFTVLACNNDGVWNQTGAAIELTILPAFHQTRTFQGLLVVAALGLLAGGYRWRVRRVRVSMDRRFEARLAERTRIAQELHDTLLQGFLSASMQLHVAIDELEPEAPARPRLERIQALINEVVDEGRRVLQGLRASDRTADDLALALSRVPGEIGAQEQAEFLVVTEGTARPLLPSVRDEIYRIAREALVNAFRHSNARTIEVELEYGARRLRVMVRDDGKGIDPEVVRAGRPEHWGLPGMRERSEAIGGQLRVWSGPGSGTEVELTLPCETCHEGGATGLWGWWRRRVGNRQLGHRPRSEGTQ